MKRLSSICYRSINLLVATYPTTLSHLLWNSVELVKLTQYFIEVKLLVCTNTSIYTQ